MSAIPQSQPRAPPEHTETLLEQRPSPLAWYALLAITALSQQLLPPNALLERTEVRLGLSSRPIARHVILEISVSSGLSPLITAQQALTGQPQEGRVCQTVWSALLAISVVLPRHPPSLAQLDPTGTPSLVLPKRIVSHARSGFTAPNNLSSQPNARQGLSGTKLVRPCFPSAQCVNWVHTVRSRAPSRPLVPLVHTEIPSVPPPRRNAWSVLPDVSVRNGL